MAAFSITNTVSQLTWVFFMGLGNGVGVLIGKKIGEGDKAGAFDYASRIVLFGPLAACGVAFILIPLSWTLPVLFKVSPQVLTDARAMFIILSISYPFKAFNMSMVVGICRAGGDTIFCALYDLLFMWVAALPLAALAAFLGGSSALIYACLLLEEPLKGILGLWRFKSRKWLHDVTLGI
jgi:Na+-driven multidrug efflux pump